jgi:hypothetical protein
MVVAAHLASGSPVDVHSYPHPHGVVVADFNSDGNLDAATDRWGNYQIEILRGDGTRRTVAAKPFIDFHTYFSGVGPLSNG